MISKATYEALLYACQQEGDLDYDHPTMRAYAEERGWDSGFMPESTFLKDRGRASRRRHFFWEIASKCNLEGGKLFREGKEMIPSDQVEHCIEELHQCLGHRGRDKLWPCVQEKYHGISRDEVDLAKDAAMGPIRSLKHKDLKKVSVSRVRDITMDDFRASLKKIRRSTELEKVDQYVNWNNLYGDISND